MKVHFLNKKSKLVEFNEEEQALARLLRTDKRLSCVAFASILTVSAVFWYFFFNFIGNLTPWVYSLFGVSI